MKRLLLISAIFSIALFACNNTDTQRVENLTAFAYTYGLVRWFHPSDEAQEIDWNRFAQYGASQVTGSRSVDDLKKTLETLDNVRYREFGFFVGSNTAGCNGRMNFIFLPSGREAFFTGMKALSTMGADHYFYRTGIAPDVYVEDTPEDVKIGRDAVLEKALELAGYKTE